MSKAKYTVKKGELAQMKTTGEPVWVLGLYEKDTDKFALISRPIVTSEGIQHSEERVLAELLETRFEQAKRTVEFENFVQDLRDDAANKRYELSAEAKTALEANAQQTLPFSR